MEKTRRPVWFQAVCVFVMASACVAAGLAAGARIDDALFFGIPGGAWIGFALADLTWWDVLFYGSQA